MKKILLRLSVIVIFLSPILLNTSFSDEGSPPEIYIFVDSKCEECVEEYDKYVYPIVEKYDVSVKLFDISNLPDYEIFLAVEEYFNKSLPMGPAVLFHDSIMGKDEIIRGKFAEKISSESIRPIQSFNINVLDRRREGVRPADGKIEKREALLFSKKGCKECNHVLKKLELLRKKYPDFSYEIFYIEDIQACRFYDFLADKMNIPEDKVLIAPALVIGDTFLSGNSLKFSDIEKNINKKTPVTVSSLYSEFVNIESGDSEERTDNILGRFGSFSIAAVFTAGLIDGINPCAFGAIIFFVTCLWTVKKEKKDILIVGIFFIGTVFATYLIMGLGIFKVLETLFLFDMVRRAVSIIYSAVAFSLFILAGLSLMDLINSLRGHKSKMVLVLTENRKKKINSIISKNIRTSHIAIGAASTAFMVSVLEVICTGQVYLPTILYVIKVKEFQGRALSLLFLYNAAFVIPLILVFLISFSGIGAHFFARLSRQDVTFGKALLFICFLVLGILFLFIR